MKTKNNHYCCKNIIIFVCLIVFKINVLWAHHEIKVTRYNASDGLADNSLYCIIQDYQGFLWFGTRNGLHKYDGYSFQVYQHELNDSATIAENWIYSLYEDKDKKLWIGSKSYLSLYIRKTNTFKNYKVLPNDIGAQDISSISEDRSGRIWITVSNRGIFIFNRNTEKFTPAWEIYKVLDKTFYLKKTDGEKKWNLQEFGFSSSVVCDSSEIWIGTTYKGLYRFNPETNKIDHFTHLSKKHSISDNHIKRIINGKDSSLWVATMNGLNRLDRKNDSFKCYFNSKDDPYSIADNNIHNITEDDHGNLWITTLNGWVNCFYSRSNKFHRIKRLPSLRLNPVFVDHSGIIWVGSIDEGLFKLDPNIVKFSLYTQKSNEPHTIYGSYIQSITTDDDGNIWIGGDMPGIHKINRQTGVFSFFETDPDYNSHPNIYDILFDHKTGIWVAAQKGVYIFNKSGKITDQFLNDPNKPYSIAENQINKIFEDSNGNIWLGTNYLNLYDRNTKTFTSFNQFEKNNDWYHILSLSDICEDKEGNFWLGTFVMGLLEFNPETKLFKGFKKSKNETTSALHLLVDKKGRLWHTKNYNGLFLFDIDKEKDVKQITEKDGLLDNAVQSIEEDDNGNLWIGSHRGLTKYNPDKNTFKNYFKEDGLQNNEFRFFSSYKNEKGELFFAGQYGLNVFYPDSINDHDYIAPVVFTDFKISNTTVKPGNGSPLKDNINIAHKIMLAHDQNDITISFAALDFSLPQRNKYSFILENFDNDWRSENNRNYAEYTNLDPGEYVFKVRGTNSDGVWNEQTTRLQIIIYPPWWQTSWAYLSYLVIVLSLIYIIRRYELNRLHFKNQVQIEATKLKEREEVDRLKSTFFTNISHEFRTPLTLILGPLNKLILQAINNDDKKVFKIMQRNANRLLNLINQLLDISKLESGQMQLAANKGDIVAFVKGILMSFHSLAEHKSVSVDFSSQKEKIDVYFDREKAEKIFTNILSNAFKFTPEGGEVGVLIEQTPTPNPSQEGNNNNPLPGRDEGVGMVSITITNSGPGIPAEKLPHIFDRFYQADASMVREQEGSGIGLALTKELVELHHGTISAASEPEEQTMFTVILPSGTGHLKHQDIIEIPSKAGETDIKTVEVESIPEKNIREKNGTEKTVILVVEDNADMRNYINDTLKDKYHVEQAFDGEAGIMASKKIIPDLIISDLMMPKKDGYQLCSEVKQDQITSHIPVILLTAKAERKDKLQGLETGADDYLIKPFDSQELLIRIKNLVEQRRRLRERFSSSIKVEPKNITVTSMDAEFLRKAMDIVEENMNNENFNVEMMSEFIGLGRRQLYHKIKALTGFTPTDFILNLRLKKAALLLSQKSGTVSEIAYKVGFNNLSYFARAFKKQFGTTPSRYYSSTDKEIPSDYPGFKNLDGL